jgi:hypothetical protein
MQISASAVIQGMTALGKYVVLLVIVVLAFKFLVGWHPCRVASDDPGMRPAIGSTRTWLTYDRGAWTEPDLSLGDIVVTYMEHGQNGQDSRAFPFRVVAVGGEWMKVEGGAVVRYRDMADQQGQGESYSGAEVRMYSTMQPIPRLLVPRGYAFFLSDNRANAVTSGPGLIPVSQVLGKVKL